MLMCVCPGREPGMWFSASCVSGHHRWEESATSGLAQGPSAPESDGTHLPSSPPSSLCKRKKKQPLGSRSQKKKMQLCVMPLVMLALENIFAFLINAIPRRRMAEVRSWPGWKNYFRSDLSPPSCSPIPVSRVLFLERQAFVICYLDD